MENRCVQFNKIFENVAYNGCKVRVIEYGTGNRVRYLIQIMWEKNGCPMTKQYFEERKSIALDEAICVIYNLNAGESFWTV